MARSGWYKAALLAAVAGCVAVPGCSPGSENDAEFLKEAGVGTPIPDADLGYADRKEKRQAQLDEESKSKTKKGARGSR